MRKFAGHVARLAAKGKELDIAAHLFHQVPHTDWNAAPPTFTPDLFQTLDPDWNGDSSEGFKTHDYHGPVDQGGKMTLCW